MATNDFTTLQVSRISGFSVRQLDYWANTGLLMPSIRQSTGPGTRKLYSFDDLVRLCFIKKLRDAGLSIQKARNALEQLDKFTADGSGYRLVALVHDKKTLLALCETEEKQQILLDILNPSGQQVLWIVLETLRGETRKNADQLLTMPAINGLNTDSGSHSASPNGKKAIS
jgi:DNA-binding transcriptional MerR regulator